jgi:hypothetical protein
MTKIFIAGSLSINNLDEKVCNRINNIIASKFEVIVGDANGVDSSIQSYLQSKNNKLVTVYCSGKRPRNNIGNWEIKTVQTNARPGTREFFTAKDIVMADDSDYGFMIWDARSTGTVSNCLELLKRKRLALVYIQKNKDFMIVRSVKDIKKMLSFMSKSAYKNADLKLRIDFQINLISQI